MKRDMDLVRDILTEVEKKDGGGRFIKLDFPSYSPEEVHYHVDLLSQAGLLNAERHSTTAGPRSFAKSLTWTGHDFLDAGRNDTVWNSAKQKIGAAVGTVSIEVFKAVLVEVAKGMMGLK